MKLDRRQFLKSLSGLAAAVPLLGVLKQKETVVDVSTDSYVPPDYKLLQQMDCCASSVAYMPGHDDA